MQSNLNTYPTLIGKDIYDHIQYNYINHLRGDLRHIDNFEKSINHDVWATIIYGYIKQIKLLPHITGDQQAIFCWMNLEKILDIMYGDTNNQNDMQKIKHITHIVVNRYYEYANSVLENDKDEI